MAWLTEHQPRRSVINTAGAWELGSGAALKQPQVLCAEWTIQDGAGDAAGPGLSLRLWRAFVPSMLTVVHSASGLHPASQR